MRPLPQDGELYSAIAAAALPGVPSMSPHTVSDLAMGLANAGYGGAEDPLFEALSLAAEQQLNRFSIQFMSELLW